MIQTIDLLIEASWVVPIEPLGLVLTDHTVAINGGKILAVLPTKQAREEFIATETVSRPGHVLMPGLVNCHIHSPMTLMRGIADDLPLMTWLQDHIWPAESKYISAEFVRDGSEIAIAESIRGGVTYLNENYFFPDAFAATASVMGMRATVGLPIIEFQTAWASNIDEYFSKALAVYDDLRGNALIKCALAPHAPYTVGDASLSRIRTLSDQLDLPVHIHVHETEFEVEDAFSKLGQRPLSRLKQLDLLNDRLIAVHMTQLTEHEIEQCAFAGVSVVHCPESNLKLASGFAPVHRLQQAGVNVALGTDGVASNNDLDMFGELQTAALLAKAVAKDASALNAANALRMATLNGAKAVGLADRIGSIEVGKEADLITVAMDGLESLPVFNPLSHLVYANNRRNVRDVWIAGARKLDDGLLVGIDVDSLKAKAMRWGRLIAG